MGATERIASATGFDGLSGFRNGRRLIVGLLVVTLVGAILLPIYWTFAVSVRSSAEVFAGSGNLLIDPASLEWSSYTTVLFQQGFIDLAVNSLIIATGNMILVMVLAVPAAYAFRLGLRGSKDIFFWILTNRMAPPVVFLLPVFFLVSALGLSGTYIGLILVYCLFNLPFAIWLLYGIMKGIPDAVDEAIYVDGGNDVDVFFEVIVPLSKPGIAVGGLLVWLFAWNHYVFTILLTSGDTATLTNGIAQFFTSVGTAWSQLAAATVITMIPGLVFAAFVQRHIVTGLTFGAVKE
jgi:multiple sugar transport system permease protein